MFKPTRLWEALAYNTPNREKTWVVLDGIYEGRKFMFSGVKSYFGDIDSITIKDIETEELYDMIENINIIEYDNIDNIDKRKKNDTRLYSY